MSSMRQTSVYHYLRSEQALSFIGREPWEEFHFIGFPSTYPKEDEAAKLRPIKPRKNAHALFFFKSKE